MTRSEEAILSFERATEWGAWLKKHHAQPEAVWLRLGKQGKGLSYKDSLEVALVWGWIDSHKRALDEEAWLQRYGPRKAKSAWSKINRTKAEALIAAGKMEAPGLREVERAKADGRWDRAYDGAKSAVVPPDLAAALAKNERARTFFAALSGANRYAILYRVQTAKKAETRAARIERFVGMCARGETLH